MITLASRRIVVWSLGSLVAIGFALTWASAGAGAQQPKSNLPTPADHQRIAAAAVPPGLNQLHLTCQINRPSQVDRFFIVCASGTTQIDVAIADCCIPGDHWQVKAKAWDEKPNTAVQTAPPNNAFSPPARVVNYGGTSSNHDLKALIECSYLNGVDVFPAGSFITVTSTGGTCTSTPLGQEDRIDRAP